MPANAKDADLKLPLPSKNRFTELRQQITAREARLRELVGDTFLVTHLIDENTHGLRLDQFLIPLPDKKEIEEALVARFADALHCSHSEWFYV